MIWIEPPSICWTNEDPVLDLDHAFTMLIPSLNGVACDAAIAVVDGKSLLAMDTDSYADSD